MTTTVKQLKEWLNQFDEETEVEVVRAYDGGWNGCTTEPLQLVTLTDSGSEWSNRFWLDCDNAEYFEYKGTKTLTLGRKD